MMKRVSYGHPVKFAQSRELNLTVPQQNLTDTNLGMAKNLYRKNLFSHYGCVNAIEFSNDGTIMASAGDDRRVMIWDVHKTIHNQLDPLPMEAQHNSNVFVVAFDNKNTKLLSGGNDDQVIVHDLETLKPVDYFPHDDPVYGISVDPLNDHVFSTACDDGQLLIYDIRNPPSSSPFILAKTSSAFHAVMFNPVEPRLIVSANIKSGISLWDVRKPEVELIKYGGKNPEQCCMSARFSQDGSKVLALRRRLPPILYDTHSSNHLFQFYHPGYYNSCTMKSCSFVGTNDQFVISGSDNFDLYMWKIPTTIPPLKSEDQLVHNACLTLRGHRSIVNQVRFNSTYSLIASSGVEKVIKFWSPFSLPIKQKCGEYDSPFNYKRRIFTNNDYVNLILQSGQFLSLTYDTSRRTTHEDPRMLAFFDALVQRDIEGMSEDEGEFNMGNRKVYKGLHRPTNHPEVHHVQNLDDEENDSDNDEEEDTGSSLDLPDVQEINNQENVIEIVSSADSSSGDDSSLSDVNSQIHPISNIEVPEAQGVEPECTENEVDGPKTSKSSSSSDDLNRTPPNKEHDNIITQLIAKKHDQLLRMAKKYMELEEVGMPSNPRSKKLNLIYEARRMRRRRGLFPIPLQIRHDHIDRPIIYSPPSASSADSSSTSSSSSSSSSSSDSSESDEDNDEEFRDLGSRIKPLLISRSNSTSNHKLTSSNSKSSSDTEIESYAENAIRRRRLKRKFKDLKVPVPKNATPTRNGDDEPCTSATAMRRNGFHSSSKVVSSSSSSSSTQNKNVTSSSILCNNENIIADNSGSSSENTGDVSDNNDYIKRFEVLSKGLTKVENRFAKTVERVSEKVDVGSKSPCQLKSTSSDTSTNSDDKYEKIVHMLPSLPKRMRVTTQSTNEKKTEDSQTGQSGNASQSIASTACEGIPKESNKEKLSSSSEADSGTD